MFDQFNPPSQSPTTSEVLNTPINMPKRLASVALQEYPDVWPTSKRLKAVEGSRGGPPYHITNRLPRAASSKRQASELAEDNQLDAPDHDRKRVKAYEEVIDGWESDSDLYECSSSPAPPSREWRLQRRLFGNARYKRSMRRSIEQKSTSGMRDKNI